MTDTTAGHGRRVLQLQQHHHPHLLAQHRPNHPRQPRHQHRTRRRHQPTRRHRQPLPRHHLRPNDQHRHQLHHRHGRAAVATDRRVLLALRRSRGADDLHDRVHELRHRHVVEQRQQPDHDQLPRQHRVEHDRQIDLTDTTAGTAVGYCSFSNTTTLTCSLNTGQTIPASHGISIELDGVTNPPAGTVNLSLATTSDLTTSTATSYTIGPAGHASQASVTLTSVAPSAQGITYTIAFATSNTGTLSNAANSQITINFPAGTGLSPITSSTVTDTTAAATVGFCSFSNTTTLTCSLNTGKSVPAGHSISIRLAGVTNPPNASTSSTLSLQTTSDTTQATSSGYQGSSAPPPPAVTGVNPSSGPTSGDTSVTITGTNLSGATSVSFGSNGATNVNVLSSTQITATSPPGSGTVDVTLTTPGGTSATGPADRFTYNAPPPPPPPSSPPGVSGGAPTSKSSSGAAVSGSVNPESLATTAFFQYGLDPAYRGPGASTTLYDQSTPLQQVGADSTTHTVTAPLSGLVPGALYHVRLVAINSAGTTSGWTRRLRPPRPPRRHRRSSARPRTHSR